MTTATFDKIPKAIRAIQANAPKPMVDEDGCQEETWAAIPVCPEYAASSLGRIKRIAIGHNTYDGFVLNPSITFHGYTVVSIHSEGKRRQWKIHQLIWIAFHGSIPDGLVIDHKNRIKTDNRLENLRLADAALNAKNRRSYKGCGNPAARLTQANAEEIRGDNAAGMSYVQISVKHGVSKSLVAQIVRKEVWS